MRIFGLVTAIAAGAIASPASAFALPGTYVAEGSCPGESPYRGIVTIRRSGGLFHALTWRIGNDTILGTAMEVEGHVVIEFRFANGTSGLMEMRADGHRWRGHWAVAGTGALCTESWSAVR